MKLMIPGALLVASFVFTACNNSDHSSAEHAAGQPAAIKDSAASQASTDTSVPAVKPQFANIDAKAMTAVKTVIDGYLVLKNALAADDGKAAAEAGKAMEDALGKVDKSAFTADQKKLYDGSEEALKEHAEHIGKNGGNIEHQREHFSEMSADVYILVKAFGGGQTLYQDHCPMYKDKGANWLSETSSIKNPYMGSKMSECGEVKEKIWSGN